jgi:hypothetical protein
MIASTLNINTISSVNRIDFGGFASIQGTGTSLYLANVSNIEPPSGTDMLINQSAPGRLLLGGRNGEVSLNIGVRISTTGTVMQFVQESGNNVGKIIGLDSINNIPITSLNSPNLTVSTLTAANYVSTPQLTVSSINGQQYIPSVFANYTLSGTTAGAVITTKGTGATSSLTQNVFTSTSQITFNLPSVLGPTDSVFYDGFSLNDFQANFNSFWGVSYYTNTVSTPTDILGSTTSTVNALNFSNQQQIYLPLNLIIPPTNITAGGTITLTIFCNPTSTNHYLTIPPINTARIGIVSD